jgi:catechol 2,3-dioxygenase-like lactoylglutathione lyase family enzyme
MLSPMAFTSIDHVGLSVLELEAATAFYERAFGFEPEVRFELPGAIQGLMMIGPAGVRLELFEHPESRPGLGGAAPLQAPATRGYGHFAVAAPSIDPLFERALAAGAASLMAPGPSPEPGVRMAFVADPEGNLIELVERR